MSIRHELEFCMIGTGVHDPKWIPYINAKLQDYEWEDQSHGYTWTEMKRHGGSVDVLTLVSKMNGHGLKVADLTEAEFMAESHFLLASGPDEAIRSRLNSAIGTLADLGRDAQLRRLGSELAVKLQDADNNAALLFASYSNKAKAIIEDASESKIGEMYTAADLEHMDIPEARWVIDNLLPEGAVILGGKPKAGKSWLALNIALAVATGGMALGNRPVQAGDVMYLALEDNKKRMQDRIRACKSGFPEKLHISHDWPQIGEGCIEKITEWIEDHPDSRLVVVDTLAKITPARGRNQDAYASDYQTIAALQGIAMKYNICVFILTHVRKGRITTPEDVIDEITGTLGKSGAADAIMALSRDGGETSKPGNLSATLQGRGRDIVGDVDQALEFDSSICTWIDQGSAPDARLSKERHAIVSVLRDHDAVSRPTGIAPKAIADAVGRQGVSVRKMLAAMKKAGQVEGGGSKYWISP